MKRAPRRNITYEWDQELGTKAGPGKAEGRRTGGLLDAVPIERPRLIRREDMNFLGQWNRRDSLKSLVITIRSIQVARPQCVKIWINMDLHEGAARFGTLNII